MSELSDEEARQAATLIFSAVRLIRDGEPAAASVAIRRAIVDGDPQEGIRRAYTAHATLADIICQSAGVDQGDIALRVQDAAGAVIDNPDAVMVDDTSQSLLWVARFVVAIGNHDTAMSNALFNAHSTDMEKAARLAVLLRIAADSLDGYIEKLAQRQ